MARDKFRSEFNEELYAIADWWLAHAVDESQGGFIGNMDCDNVVTANADKGVILNARILWFFSEAALFSGNDNYRSAANRACDYLLTHFIDPIHGGVYWRVDAWGNAVNKRKQVYAQAFAIYGLVAYYRLSQKEAILETALALFDTLESKARDDQNGGYLEAFSCDWQPLVDMRLSERDMNSPKSMNTHLHLLEAYCALYSVEASAPVEDALRRCLGYFDEHIIDKQTYQLRLYQSMEWRGLSTTVSFGHDIECSWLIWEAAQTLQDVTVSEYYRPLVLRMAESVLKNGVGPAGEVWDTYDVDSRRLSKERIWWVQAEAMVGFLNAYVLSKNDAFYSAFMRSWEFVCEYQKDHQHGEWLWLSALDSPRRGECKIGAWKAPYHNGRAMMQVCKLLTQLGE